MLREIVYLNNECDRLNAERIKLLSSPVYQIGRRVYKIPVIKFLYYILYNLQKKNKNELLEKNIDKLLLKPEDLEWSPKVAVYQAVIGNYDVVKSAPLLCSDIYSFFLFADSEMDCKNWIKKEIPQHIMSLANPILINRYLKMHPYELFPDYDYAVYIDGNFQIISDIRPMLRQVSAETGLAMHKHSVRDCIYEEGKYCIKSRKGNLKLLSKQIKKYQQSGFPRYFGMFECGVIVSSLQNITGKKVLSLWWEELVSSGSLRDQIALPYILWKNDFSINSISQYDMPLYKNQKLMFTFRNRDNPFSVKKREVI